MLKIPNVEFEELDFWKSQTEELFEWYTLYLNDASTDVVYNAPRIMSRHDDGYIMPILTYAAHENKRIRAVALTALAKHDLRNPEYWFERGLKDAAAWVRIEVARLLPTLDRMVHQTLFDIARHEPHPLVKRIAKKKDKRSNHWAL